MNDNDTSAVDKFSWRRVWEFGVLYKYSLVRQMIAYGAFSIFAAIIGLMPFGPTAQVGLFSLFASALGIAYYISPVALSKWGDTRMVMNLTPALPMEKFVFFMIYFLIVLPVIVFLPNYLSQLTYLHIPSVQTEPMLELVHLSLDYNYNTISKLVQSAALMLACFYTVLVCKENRTLKGILTVFGILICVGMTGFILGFSRALMADFEINNLPANPHESVYANMTQIMAEMKTSMICITTVFSIGGIVLMRLIYQRLAHPKI